jgi:ribosomal protein S10
MVMKMSNMAERVRENYRRQGVLAERERIIAILKSPQTREAWIIATHKTLGTYTNVVEFLAEQIMGENE